MTLPIDSQTQEWIEARTSWIVQQFGLERIRNCSVLLPDSELFANCRGNSDSQVRILVNELCRFLEIDSSAIDIRYFRAANNSFETTNPIGLYESVGGRYRISIEESLLASPPELVAVIVHELCHVLLLGEERLTGEEYDHEPLTDLLTLFLGCGVFTSNAVVYQQTLRDGNYEGWRIGRRGYLTMPMYGYAWALFAALRNEEGDKWRKHLRLDVRDAFKRSSKYLHATGLPDLSTVKETQARPLLTRDSQERSPETAEDEPVDDDDSNTCEYCTDPIPKGASHRICKQCRLSIRENQKELEGDHQKTPFADKLLLYSLFALAVIFLVGFFANVISTFFN